MCFWLYPSKVRHYNCWHLGTLHLSSFWVNICHSRQGGVLALAHANVSQHFFPVVSGQSQRLKRWECILKTVPHSHSLLVARGGHTSHLLEPWRRRELVRGEKLKDFFFSFFKATGGEQDLWLSLKVPINCCDAWVYPSETSLKSNVLMLSFEVHLTQVEQSIIFNYLCQLTLMQPPRPGEHKHMW